MRPEEKLFLEEEEQERALLEQFRKREEEFVLSEYREKAFGQARLLWQCTFDRDNGDVPQLDLARRYAEHWREMERENQGLLLWGPTGTGKTFAAACIANALAERRMSVRMTTLGQVLLRLFGLDGGARMEYLEDLVGCRLLILDDFGMERQTPYAQEQVYELINRRYLSGRPMIVTTNLSHQELTQTPGLERRRIYDRVLERCVPVCFDGTSLRQEKTAERVKRMQTLLTGGGPAD